MLFATVAAIARHRTGIALAALALSAGAPRADELTDLPLERLLETEVVSAARFARQVTDAASAVSVLTAEDIRIFGLRTMGEVLDHMRGIHISHSLDYVYLGSRGVGGDSFASLVLMLVDGNPPPDNLYDQLYLGRDALLDVAMIERIEYAPGSGSAMYGNNALLGVINVVTKRGRDIDGLQVSGELGDWSQRTWRVSAGQRHASGLEWLASFTGHADTALPSPQVGDQFDRSIGHSQTVLLKAQWEGFSALLLTARRRVGTDYRDQPEQAWYTTYLDRNELLAIGHDSRPAEHWRLSLKAQTGHYAYRYGDDDTLLGRYRTANDGQWWALDGQAGYEGWASHRLVLGARLRHDPVQHFHSVDYDGGIYHFAAKRRNLGFSAEDEFTLNDQWAFTAGLRADRRDQLPWTWSPRVAVVWQPAPAWSVKASHGRSARYRSAADSPQTMGADEALAPPKEEAVTATTSELVSEYREGNLRLLGSLYRFEQRNRTGLDDGLVATTQGRGLELEAEWQWRGWRLRGSQAWQDAESGDGSPLVYSPRHLTKLQLSAPLAGEALRLSATLRRTGAMQNYAGRVPSRNLLDLTLVSQKAVDGLDLRIGWRNVLQKREAATDEYYWEPPTGVATRSAWIELTGTFR